MNALLDLLACMDWLTPLLSLLDRNVETVSLNQDQVWAADELKRLGIKVRRLMVVPFGRIAFDVPVQQVGLTITLLRQMGIDVQDGKGRPWHRRGRR
ncbi:MAG: hypothetical protein WA040_02585 [Anaerolineae bacterium]